MNKEEQKKTVQKTTSKKTPQKAATKKTVQKRTVSQSTAQKAGKSRKKTSIKQKRKARWMVISIRLGIVLLAVFFALLIVIKIVKPSLLAKNYFEMKGEEVDASKPDIDVELLTVNPYSRPGTETSKIKGIVVHYTANPGATAIANRNYFEGLKDSGERKASSHFVIGLDGEVIQCIPSSEISYASNDRNKDTLSIECCHPDESGEFNKATYTSLVQLVAWLCKRFDLEASDVIRHYDVTGKECPKYFVEHEDAWEQFQQEVSACKDKIIKEEKEEP